MDRNEKKFEEWFNLWIEENESFKTLKTDEIKEALKIISGVSYMAGYNSGYNDCANGF